MALLEIGAVLLPAGVRWLNDQAEPTNGRRISAVELDQIDESSEESFPASDPPAWTFALPDRDLQGKS